MGSSDSIMVGRGWLVGGGGTIRPGCEWLWVVGVKSWLFVGGGGNIMASSG